ncbi:MAG: alpha-L-fucosidase [Chitinophagaceae bacterium]
MSHIGIRCGFIFYPFLFFIIFFIPACSKDVKNTQPEFNRQDTAYLHFLQNHDFRSLKYGILVHYVAGATVYRDGTVCRNNDSLTANFDPVKFAAEIDSMQVEYLIFTAWHKDMRLLYPSVKMDSWITGHTSHKDLIGEILTAVGAKGIKVLLYTHPYLGYHFDDQEKNATGWGAGVNLLGDDAPNWHTFKYAKWNDFINDIYRDLLDKYGSRISGLFIDEGDKRANMDKAVDFPRLRSTIKSRFPNLIMIQNNHGKLYWSDIGAKEYFGWEEFGQVNSNKWPSSGSPVVSVISRDWWASLPHSSVALRYNVESLFTYTVVQAGINVQGGGVAWAASPYVYGGWERGVKEQLIALGELIAPISKSVKHTYASTSFITPAGSTLNQLSWGVATKSTDDSYEYIHVLKAPSGKVLKLPLPSDKKKFGSARILNSGHPVSITYVANGINLTLQNADAWDSLDTVIELTVLR